MTSFAVSPRKMDILRFEAMARRGEVPGHATGELAAVFAAARKAHIAIGPGHCPLDAILKAMPTLYVENWLKKRKKAARLN